MGDKRGVGGGVMRWCLVGGGKRRGKGRVCWKRGLELWKVFFFFCFFLGGGEEGLGGRVEETVESKLSDVERGEDGKGVVNRRERWGKRGGRVEDVGRGRFWERNFGVVDGGEGWEEGFHLLFCFLDFFGRSSGGGMLHRLNRGKGRGGERGGKKGGRLERKGYRVGGEKRKRKMEGMKKGEMGMRELSLEKRGGGDREMGVEIEGGNEKIIINDLIFEDKSVISIPPQIRGLFIFGFFRKKQKRTPLK